MIPTVHFVIVRIAERLGINTVPPLVELEPIAATPPGADEARAATPGEPGLGRA
jgi:hypothetical protein